LRMSIQELPAEADTKFVDEPGIDGVRVPHRDDLVFEVDIILGTVTHKVLREGGARPGHAIVAIFARIIEPFDKEFALLTPLMIDLNGKIVGILAAAQRTEEVVTNLVAIQPHGTAAQRIIIVW